MRVKKCLIIENEPFLSESIATKLDALGFSTMILSTTKKAIDLDERAFSVVVLSANLQDEENFFKIIRKFKKATVILMVTYINNDFLVKAIEYGANDYILKPFIIESLIKKITTFQRIQDLEDREKRYLKFMNRVFESDPTAELKYELDLPIFIISKVERFLDSFAFFYAKHINKMVEFISIKDLKNLPQNHNTAVIYYFRNFSTLLPKEKEDLLNIGKKLDMIIGSTEAEKELKIDNYKITNVMSNIKFIDIGEILSVPEYIKQIIIHNQYKMPDTEISKNLGISRKSLWEKRRKMDIQKKRKLLEIETNVY